MTIIIKAITHPRNKSIPRHSRSKDKQLVNDLDSLVPLVNGSIANYDCLHNQALRR